MYRMLPQCLKAAWTRHRQRHVRIRTWDEFTRAEDADVGSVAIVGNAGYLADLDQGHEIDQHAVVIRLNNFRTTGFERHVGTRCDMFFTNFFTDIRFDRDELRTARHVVASVPNAFAKRRRRHLHHRHAEHIVDGLTLLGRRDVSVPSATEFAAACDTCRAVPSTGMMAVRFALRHLRFERLFITGYSFFRGGGHYFPNLRSSGKLHDFRRERRLLASLLVPLLDSGRVRADPLLDEDLRAAA
jgi:hypothetical protein